MQTSDNSTLYDFDPDAQPESEQTITVGHVSEPHDFYGGRHTHGSQMGETNPPSKGWLGNPFTVAQYGREECIEKFEQAFIDELRDNHAFCNAVTALDGNVVACHCRETSEDSPSCHLDVVREMLLDGTVFAIAHHVHDIPLCDWKLDVAAEPEELL